MFDIIYNNNQGFDNRINVRNTAPLLQLPTPIGL